MSKKRESMTVIERSDYCFQCGESKEAVKESQRRGGQHVLYCAIVDAEGECLQDFDKHNFVHRYEVRIQTEAKP